MLLSALVLALSSFIFLIISYDAAHSQPWLIAAFIAAVIGLALIIAKYVLQRHNTNNAEQDTQKENGEIFSSAVEELPHGKHEAPSVLSEEDDKN